MNKLKKDLQIKIKAMESKTDLMIEKRFSELPLHSKKKSIVATTESPSLNTLYANEVNIGMNSGS